MLPLDFLALAFQALLLGAHRFVLELFESQLLFGLDPLHQLKMAHLLLLPLLFFLPLLELHLRYLKFLKHRTYRLLELIDRLALVLHHQPQPF